MNTRTIFDRVKLHISNYERVVSSAFNSYDAKMKEAKSLYSDAVVANKESTYSTERINTINQARKELKANIEKCAADIRKQYADWLFEPAPLPFVNYMHSVHEYGVQLNPDEIRLLIDSTGYNALALRMIVSEAARNDITVKVPLLDSAIDDIKILENIPRRLEKYAPNDHFNEAARLFGVPAYMIAMARIDSSKIDEMAKRWSGADVSVNIPAASNSKAENDARNEEINEAIRTVEVMEDSSRAVDMAKEIGKGKADKTSAVMSHYMI